MDRTCSAEHRAFALAQLRKNLAFEAMPRMQARVEIAKDVLAALDIGKIVPASMYIAPADRYHPYEELRDIVARSGACLACQVGGLLLAVVARDARFKLQERGPMVSSMVARLSPFFDMNELAFLEAAFECCTTMAVASVADLYDSETTRFAVKWGNFIVAGRGFEVKAWRMRILLALLVVRKGRLCTIRVSEEQMRSWKQQAADFLDDWDRNLIPR